MPNRKLKKRIFYPSFSICYFPIRLICFSYFRRRPTAATCLDDPWLSVSFLLITVYRWRCCFHKEELGKVWREDTGTRWLYDPFHTDFGKISFSEIASSVQVSFHVTTPEEFQNVTITGHFGFVFEEASVREITWLSWRNRFWNVSIDTKINEKPTFSNSHGLRSVFEKLRSRDGLVWTVGLTVKIELRF